MATVRELIEHLSQFPEDAEVKISTYGCGTTVIYEYDLQRIQMLFGDLVIEAEDN